MTESLDALEAQYLILKRNLDNLRKACGTDDQEAIVTTNYEQARDNYEQCISKAFDANDPAVVELTMKSSVATAAIKGSLDDLQDIVAVLQVISGAVKIGTKLAALAA